MHPTSTFKSQHIPIDPLPTTLESERLLIRQIAFREAEEFAMLKAEALEYHLAPWSPESDLDKSPAQLARDAKEHIMLALEKWEDGTDFRFHIIMKSTGKIVGQVGVTGVLRGVNQAAFIGYWVGKPYLNQGIATESCAMALYFAFECLRLHRMHLWIAPENTPSIRVAEKLGLRFEGTVERALYLGRRWQDTHSYAITSEEWVERKEEMMRGYRVNSKSNDTV